MKKLTRKDIKILGEGPQIKKAILEQYADIEEFHSKFDIFVQFNTFKSYLSRDIIESDSFRCAITIALNKNYSEIVLPIKEQLKVFVNDIYDNIKLYRDNDDEYMLQALLKQCKKEEMQLEAAMMYRAMARNYYFTNKLIRALECFELAIDELPKEEINKQVFFWCEMAYASHCEYMRDKADKRFKCAEELIERYPNELDNHTMFYYHYWRGITFLYKGKYRVAREYFQNALKYATKNFEKAGAICSIGLSYKKVNKYRDALKYYNEALTYPDEANISPTVVTCNNISEVYRKLKDYEKALDYVSLAIEANEKQYNLSNHLLCIQTKVEIQLELGNEGSYKEYFKALLDTKGKQLSKSTQIFNLKAFITDTTYNLPCLRQLTRVIIDLSKASDSEDYISGLYECLGMIYLKLIEHGGIKYETAY